MSGLDIRLASPDDAQVLGRLLSDFNQEFETEGPTAEEFSRRLSMLLGRDDVVAILGERSSRPAGFAFLTLRPTPYYDGSFAQLEELYVVPDARDQGIGTAIVELATQVVIARGAAEIHINVDEIDHDARRFYERHGFFNVEPGRDYRMLCYVREL